MVLLDDVVEVFALTHQAIDAGVSLDAPNGCCVGATLAGSDLLWHILKVDSTFQKRWATLQCDAGSADRPRNISRKSTSLTAGSGVV